LIALRHVQPRAPCHTAGYSLDRYLRQQLKPGFAAGFAVQCASKNRAGYNLRAARRAEMTDESALDPEMSGRSTFDARGLGRE